MSTPNPDNPNGKPDIIIQPFDPNSLGSNSYDLHLNKMLKVYTRTLPKGMTPAIKYTEGKKYSMRDNFTSFGYYLRYLLDRSKYDIRNPKYFIDPRDRKKETIDLEIPESGLILLPGIGYLGSTEEWTETYRLFPQIDGKSSTGRNFILNHHTAGRGDDGFCGTWTLEIQVLYPTMVFPLMPFGQIYYEEFIGDRKPYNENPNSHYNGQKGPTPAAEISNEMYREAIQKQK
ncbi:MAG: hypothetical protein LBD50_00755 [Rickettsiales bacterium]|jgi:dCTP deaminase|nr:hypothetical protein [Rickettsiales bacterium]